MKKLLFLIILISFLVETKSQVVFCPAGATWNYRFNNGFGPTIDNETIKYTGDSLVDGISVKVLSHTKFFTSGDYVNTTLIKQVGDTVFMRNARTLNAWQVLYNYNVLPGQSWYNTLLVGQATNSAMVNYTITVDSVSQVTENGFNLKKLVVKYFSSYGGGGHKVSVTERFGCSFFLFNFVNKAFIDADYVTGFLCYSDLAFGTKQFTTLPCDFSNRVGLENVIPSSQNIKVYPNPFSETLNLEFESSSDKMMLSIVDIQGREVMSSDLQQKNKIDLKDFNRGIYFLSLSQDGEIIFKSKIVKTQ